MSQWRVCNTQTPSGTLLFKKQTYGTNTLFPFQAFTLTYFGFLILDQWLSRDIGTGCYNCAGKSMAELNFPLNRTGFQDEDCHIKVSKTFRLWVTADVSGSHRFPALWPLLRSIWFTAMDDNQPLETVWPPGIFTMNAATEISAKPTAWLNQHRLSKPVKEGRLKKTQVLKWQLKTEA